MAAIGRLKEIDGHKVYVLNKGVVVQGVRDAYKVVGSRGHGGFAVTYAVRAQRTGVLSVLKISSDFRKKGWGGERILREAMILRRCGRLNRMSVPEIIDSGEVDGRPFFIMENLYPLSWSDDEMGLPDTKEKRRLFFMLLVDGLKTVHEAGFIHCDLKPTNIMQRKNEHRPVLIDFGSAHPIVSGPACCQKLPKGWREVTRMAGRAFTPGYDADEDVYTVQKDIFALGQVMRDSFGKDVDLAWGEIINKCISRRRDLRYENLDALRLDIENVAKRERRIYAKLRKDRIREQRDIERSLASAEIKHIGGYIVEKDAARSTSELAVLNIDLNREVDVCTRYLVDSPIRLGENTVLFISGRGVLNADISGPASSVVVLRDYAVFHNTNGDLPPVNDLNYVLIGPGSYLNFQKFGHKDYAAFFPEGRRRIFRDIDATTSFRFKGPSTFSGVESDTLDGIEDSAMPQCYKDVLTKFFKGETFTVFPEGRV